MKIHSVADIFPAMSDADFASLKADIEEHGVREPIWTWHEYIIDGRHRFKAASELMIECPMRAYHGDEASLVSFVVSLNLKRRHLDESQRAMVATTVANLDRGRPLENPPIGGISNMLAAEMLNVGIRSVERAAKVRADGAPELVQAVEQGRVSVSAAADVATLTKPEQVQIVARGEAEILQAAKQIRSVRAETRRAEIAKVKAHAPELPDGRYDVIVIDPPWQMEKIERDVRPNQVAFEYPTMTEDELRSFGIPSLSHDDCHLFCWTTHKHMPMALRLVDAWGFRYVCTMVWHKPGGFQPIGLPQYNCEFVVYARKGSPQFVDTKAFPCCFEAPRREHSRKPDEFYSTVARVTAGQRIDVFSRERREGFDQFGNETGKFSA